MAVIELVTEAYKPKAPTAKKATPATKAAPPRRRSPRPRRPTTRRRPGRAAAEAAGVATFTEVPEGADDEVFEETEGGSAGKYDGSHVPLEDASEAPEGFPIKGNEDSMKYHTPDGQWFEQTVAEVWFDTEESAQAAGFTKAGE